MEVIADEIAVKNKLEEERAEKKKQVGLSLASTENMCIYCPQVSERHRSTYKTHFCLQSH